MKVHLERALNMSAAAVSVATVLGLDPVLGPPRPRPSVSVWPYRPASGLKRKGRISDSVIRPAGCCIHATPAVCRRTVMPGTGHPQFQIRPLKPKRGPAFARPLCGADEIRTHEGVSPFAAYQTAGFSHSPTADGRLGAAPEAVKLAAHFFPPSTTTR